MTSILGRLIASQETETVSAVPMTSSQSTQGDKGALRSMQEVPDPFPNTSSSSSSSSSSGASSGSDSDDEIMPRRGKFFHSKQYPMLRSHRADGISTKAPAVYRCPPRTLTLTPTRTLTPTLSRRSPSLRYQTAAAAGGSAERAGPRTPFLPNMSTFWAYPQPRWGVVKSQRAVLLRLWDACYFSGDVGGAVDITKCLLRTEYDQP